MERKITVVSSGECRPSLYESFDEALIDVKRWIKGREKVEFEWEHDEVTVHTSDNGCDSYCSHCGQRIHIRNIAIKTAARPT